MSSLAIPEQVSPIALPAEFQLGHLPASLPADAMSFNVKVQPTNLTQVQSANITLTASSTLDVPFNATNVILEIPCNQSPDTFLDCRFSQINFKVNCTCTAAGSASVITSMYQRGGGYSWFDSMTILGPTGSTLEQIQEYGVVYDTLVAGQMNNSVRDGAVNMGFSSGTGIDNQGFSWAIGTANTVATTNTETHSISLPLLSGVCGVLSNNFLNVGRLGRLQLILQTAFQLPVSIITGSATTAGTIQFTLSDFSLSLEMIKIGASALKMLDETLVNGMAYTSGITYRTSVSTMTASSGLQSILAGIRGSSIKSLFLRLVDGGAVSTTNSVNGKYDCKNSNLTSYQFNLAGIKFPQTAINPLQQASQAYCEFQKALGNFNSSAYQCGISTANYYKLSAGSTGQSLSVGATQNYEWTTGSSISAQCQFIMGQNIETISRRGLFSGYSLVSSPLFVELNCQAATTNSHNVYVIGMLDMVLIHNVNAGTLDARV